MALFRRSRTAAWKKKSRRAARQAHKQAARYGSALADTAQNTVDQATSAAADLTQEVRRDLREVKAQSRREARHLRKAKKHEAKRAQAALKRTKEQQWNRKKVARYAGVAQMLVPFALPLVYKAVSALQAKKEDLRAQRYGVSQEQLRSFTGHGAPLQARIAGARESLDSLQDRGFIRDAEERLDELTAAVQHAEHMTPQQRRQSHRAISREIDRVDAEILERLGVRTH